MSKSAGEEVVNEIVEHMIMEKSGVLGDHHHFLPKKKSVNKRKKKSDFWFFTLMTMFIGAELWLIYKMLI